MTPAGELAALRAAVQAGRSALTPLPAEVAQGLSQSLGARLPEEGAARGLELASRALSAALAGGARPRARTALFVGSGLGPREPWEARLAQGAIPGDAPLEPTLAGHGLTEALAERFELGGERATFAVTCVSGLCALEAARAALLLGRADAALVLGVETLSRTIQGGFCALEALSREATPARPSAQDGILLGEGACALRLERGGAEGATCLLGQALVADAVHATSPDASGAGLRAALEQALGEACLRPDELSWLTLTAPASPAYAQAYAGALEPVLGAGWRERCETWEESVGHLLAASGPLGVAWGLGREPGVALTVGFGGLSGATVVGPEGAA